MILCGFKEDLGELMNKNLYKHDHYLLPFQG